MYNWVCADLAETNQDWIFSLWHHPSYTKGSHDSDTEAQLREMRERFNPVLEAHGVDLNLTGHSHSYERSILLDGHYGNSASYDPALHAKDAGNGDPLGDGAYQKPALGPVPHQGLVYSVVGSSSKNTGGLTQHPIMAYFENFEGSLVLDVDANQLDGYFINKLGAQNDHFQIIKGSPAVCGDGVVEGREQCDDGNLLPGDCCSASCQFEATGSPCNDGLFCTMGETCSAGLCGGGKPRDCSRGDPGCDLEAGDEDSDSDSDRDSDTDREEDSDGDSDEDSDRCERPHRHERGDYDDAALSGIVETGSPAARSAERITDPSEGGGIATLPAASDGGRGLLAVLLLLFVVVILLLNWKTL